MARLPKPGGDAGDWGDVLNDFLSQEHNADGSLKRGPDIDRAKTDISVLQTGKADKTAVNVVTPANDGEFVVNVGGTPTSTDLAAKISGLTVVSRLKDRIFDARDYGASHTAADNIDAINAAIADAGAAVAANGGTARVVVGASAKTYMVRPSLAGGKWIKLKSGVTLDLSDVTLKVADDSDAYNDLITGDTLSTPLTRVRVTGGMIDHNPLGHVNANLGVGGLNKAHSIASYAVTGLIVDNVTINTSGVNTIVVNGPDCHDILIEGCDLTFTQGATTTPNYDNSALYLVADQIRVAHNRWNASIAQGARGACEIHGPNAVLIGNTTKGYQTLTNLVTPDFPYAGNRNNITVTGNSVVDANYGVTLWPVTGDVLRNVVVSNNTFHLAQIDWNQSSAYGVARSRSAGITGDEEGYIVANNVIAYQPGDTRSTDATGTALNYTSMAGVGIGGGGQTRHARVQGNIILNSPCYGVRVGVSGSGSLNDVSVIDNTIVDAGSDPNGVARMAVALYGAASYCSVRDNHIHDTGASVLNGQNGMVVQVSSGANNVVTRNRVTTASGLAMSTSITNSDNFVTFYTKRVTLDFPSIAAGSTALLAATVQGAAPGDAVIATPNGAIENGLVYGGYVASANTVTIRVTNSSASAVDPASRTWDIRIIPKELNVT
jgi:hypothetical protein